MMRSQVLVDTGVLVALIDRTDRYHVWVSQKCMEIVPPLLTCEAVISETWFLLGRVRNGRETLIKLLTAKQVQVCFDLGQELMQVIPLLERYASVPVSLADAELVRMAELYPRSVVFTLDSDFQIYRKDRDRVISVLSPWSEE